LLRVSQQIGHSVVIFSLVCLNSMAESAINFFLAQH
jgi:hypothetical protein